ncbi:prepilin peptidase [Agromyces badenianii]|uniref:Prepilin peptidase n=1 Tax=Agromyces badenianii TaxID=2080742 RepID=A0A2S0WT67_9MICO|nr:A24 family peptidase [Agromyces badenianii]AWB94529.1 prepilin peptidase [Agromyces badenianii]
MPSDWSTPTVTVVAMGLGFALGWWPLANWAARSMQGEWMPRQRVITAVATAATFALLAFRFGATWTLPPLLAFAVAATVLSTVDLAEQRLPNAVVFPALAAVGLLLVPASWAANAWMSLVWALAGAGAMFAVYLLLALISPSSMGFGDVKLALVIGLLLGWFGLSAWLGGLLAAFMIGGVTAIVALALRRVTLRGSIPFGPSMLAGAVLAVLVVGP